MIPFLKQIASIYCTADREIIRDCCFIFPNKRSSNVFHNYLLNDFQIEDKRIHTMTIGAFVASFSELEEATRIEQLFILYNEYKKLVHNDVMDFDQFSFWGNMILDDFNDVDKYMVSAENLYGNLKRYKEIGSNYLTEEQIEIIHHYWGEDLSKYDTENFWKHAKSEKNNLGKKFILLWEILDNLYSNFHSTLLSENLTTSGALYRNAALKLKNHSEKNSSKFKRYVFIGFNVLSISEHIIFSRLKDRGVADFYWDINSPVFEYGFSKAIEQIKSNQKNFPSKYDLEIENSIGSPQIEITGVSGNIAQIDYVAETLNRWNEDGSIKNPDNAKDTTVVLPDESLFIPLLFNIPEEIRNINVTMGLSMRENPLSALMKSIYILQQRARYQNDEISFYYKDVLNVISFPSIRNIDAEACDILKNEIISHRLFKVSSKKINNISPSLSVIFQPLRNKENLKDITTYLTNLTNTIKEKTEASDIMGICYLNSYQEKLEYISKGGLKRNISLKGSTLLRMIEKAINSEKIHFEGEPISGLQIMGVLETRNLDFNNVIILSMNEGVLPKKTYITSFIPDIIRKGYGLPTSDFQEYIIAYYFYRLISRAKNVELVYDARSGGLKTGEYSRYLAQLLYRDSESNINHKLLNYEIGVAPLILPTIYKTPEVMTKLSLYLSGTSDEQKKNLSASSINTYINCPLEFYLRYVEGYDADTEMQDFIDSSTYGNILHNVVQDFYNHLKEQNGNRPITASILESYQKPENTIIDNLIVKNVNLNYNRLTNKPLEPLKGESLITGIVIKEMINKMIDREKDLVPIEFIEAERGFGLKFKVNDNLSVNIYQKIDRIDRITDGKTGEKILRIVDYKTGSDELKAPSIEELFISGSKHKAIMQLMLYCLLYSQEQNIDERIQPIIYKMIEIGKSGIETLKIGKEPLTDYRIFREEYEERLKSLIEEIFNPEVPFTASKDDSSCKFCSFKALCRRDN